METELGHPLQKRDSALLFYEALGTCNPILIHS